MPYIAAIDDAVANESTSDSSLSGPHWHAVICVPNEYKNEFIKIVQDPKIFEIEASDMDVQIMDKSRPSITKTLDYIIKYYIYTGRSELLMFNYLPKPLRNKTESMKYETGLRWANPNAAKMSKKGTKDRLSTPIPQKLDQ